MVVASDNRNLAVNAEAASSASHRVIHLCLTAFSDNLVSGAVALGGKFHILAVVVDESLDVRQMRIFFVFLDTNVVPDREEDREVGRHVAVIKKFSSDIVHLGVDVKFSFGKLDGEAAPHGHLAVVLDFAGLVDPDDVHLGVLFELFREVGFHLLDRVTETPGVDGLAVDHIRIAIRGADVAAGLASLAVLAGALGVLEDAGQTLDGVVAHRSGPRGHVATDLDVAGQAEVVLIGVGIEGELRDTRAGGNSLGVFVEKHCLTPFSWLLCV